MVQKKKWHTDDTDETDLKDKFYSYQQIINNFAPLQLVEFALIPDKGGLIENAAPGLVAQQQYGCGCFWFKKMNREE